MISPFFLCLSRLQTVMDELLDCSVPCAAVGAAGLLSRVTAGAWSGRIIGGPACDLPFAEGGSPFHFNNAWCGGYTPTARPSTHPIVLDSCIALAVGRLVGVPACNSIHPAVYPSVYP